MAELGKYTKAIQDARRKGNRADMEQLSLWTARMIDINEIRRAELLDEIAERHRRRWLAAKRAALAILSKDRATSSEAERRRKRWLSAKRHALEACWKTRNL
jgi:hypothetical protein